MSTKHTRICFILCSCIVIVFIVIILLVCYPSFFFHKADSSIVEAVNSSEPVIQDNSVTEPDSSSEPVIQDSSVTEPDSSSEPVPPDSLWDQLLSQYKDDPETQQLIFVKYLGGSSAELIYYIKDAGEWAEDFACSADVGQNGIDKSVDGDRRTPTGIYSLTGAFGILEDPGSIFPYLQVTDELYWCGDENFYNQLIDIHEHPHECIGEHLIDYPGYYDYGMFLDYNPNCEYPLGFAIFLHCKGSEGYTGGCIGIDHEYMIRILQTAEPGVKICIYNESA